MRSQLIETQQHQQQLATMIPVRYRILLYLNILLIIVDICINTFSEFLVTNNYGQLIIFIVQDVCIVLSLTLLIVMVLTTYVAQAGLLCLLLRMFRFSIIINIIYLILCGVIQGLLLGYRFQTGSIYGVMFSKPVIIAFYVIQRTCSVLYYYGMKRAGYRLSDPHFYQSSKWLQGLWEKRRLEATGAALRGGTKSGASATTTKCVCCTIM